MLDAEVKSLLDVAVLDFLVDDDADRALRDVVDDACLAVVDLVWHTVSVSDPVHDSRSYAKVIGIARSWCY